MVDVSTIVLADFLTFLPVDSSLHLVLSLPQSSIFVAFLSCHRHAETT